MFRPHDETLFQIKYFFPVRSEAGRRGGPAEPLPPHVRRDPRPEVRRGRIDADTAAGIGRACGRPAARCWKSCLGRACRARPPTAGFETWSYTFGGNTYPATPILPEYWDLNRLPARSAPRPSRGTASASRDVYGPIPADARARGRHRLGAHRDDEPMNDPDHDVVMVVVGATPAPRGTSDRGPRARLWPDRGDAAARRCRGRPRQRRPPVSWRKHNAGQRWTITFRALRPLPGRE